MTNAEWKLVRAYHKNYRNNTTDDMIDHVRHGHTNIQNISVSSVALFNGAMHKKGTLTSMLDYQDYIYNGHSYHRLQEMQPATTPRKKMTNKMDIRNSPADSESIPL